LLVANYNYSNDALTHKRQAYKFGPSQVMEAYGEVETQLCSS